MGGWGTGDVGHIYFLQGGMTSCKSTKQQRLLAFLLKKNRKAAAEAFKCATSVFFY